MSKREYGRVLVALALAAIFSASGCGRLDNGLPKQLVTHLADRGIQIRPIRSDAPLSSRGGYVVANYHLPTATNIIAVFKLRKIESETIQWQQAIDRAGGTVTAKELWGVAGRPAQFRLKNGAQFEYLYLLITTDGLMYLIAEYAYG